MDLSIDLTRIWAYFGSRIPYWRCGRGRYRAFVLWLVDRTHQWYVYTIVVILGVSIAWSYSSPYFEVPCRAELRRHRDATREIEAALARGRVPEACRCSSKRRSSRRWPVRRCWTRPSRRVVLTRSLVVAGTIPGVVFRVTYEIGHGSTPTRFSSP